ncbi:non-structural maintenance of chromosomes element 4 homolog A-like [Macrobrachium rosenbergii]|uniref:non-structural maintenance of chromosomes element 4 homolog A-like n=1 Tax=Macrobrachium rosenbergii TaxID=79674 RepID=UPI0034D7AD25
MSRSGSSRSGTMTVSDSSRESFTQRELMEMKERMSNEANRVVRDRYRTLLIDQQEKVDRAGEPGVPVEELRTMVCLANEEVNKDLMFFNSSLTRRGYHRCTNFSLPRLTIPLSYFHYYFVFQVKVATNDEERQTGELTRIYNILTKKYRENNKKPLCFFHFVVNPTSYSYTIENIFHTSFLVDMLRAEVREDKNGLPVIIPREPEAAKEERTHCGKENSQCLVSLSTEEFEDLIKAFDIRAAIIPPPSEGRKRSKSGV